MTTVSICIGSACHLKGSYNVINAMQELIDDNNLMDKVEIKAVFCLGQCVKAVAVKIDDEEEVYSVNPKTVKEFFNTKIKTRV